MKDIWYGDNRDFVKWGVLLSLAETYSVKRILQAAYFRPGNTGNLEIDGKVLPLPSVVRKHFRNLNGVVSLSSSPEIQVIDTEFTDRHRYTRSIVEHAVDGLHPCIVFLDPDTGLEPPKSKPKLEHVLESELSYIWKEMAHGDVLTFYQHKTTRGNEPWIEAKKAQFERALGLHSGVAKIAQGQEIASDVVFFYCYKK